MKNYRGYYISASCVARFTFSPDTVALENQLSLLILHSAILLVEVGLMPISSGTDGHVLWIAAEDDYGTERRVRHLLRQEPNASALAARFHLVRGNPDPLAFEQQCIAQVQAMAAMNMRVDLIVIDTWGASGLCFADNDTEAVLKAMFVLKNVARRTGAAEIVTDHLPMGNEDAFQKGNGAKSGNSGFVYRVTAGRQDQVSIDCCKARGAPKAKSYIGRVVSENYGKDSKGRTTTVNVFKRDIVIGPQEREQSVVLRLAAMLPGATAAAWTPSAAGAPRTLRKRRSRCRARH